MGHTHGIKWDNQLIEDSVNDVIRVLKIERFPSREEINTTRKDQALHNAIVRSGGYRFWANKMNLPIKNSETQLGQKYEEVVMRILEARGFHVERMTTKHPYDLIVNGRVKIDVKVGKAYLLRGSRCHTFRTSKRHATCDLYIMVALNENDLIEKVFIIPSFELQIVTLSLGAESKYNKYLSRWDYIEKYSSFYAQLD